MNSSSGGPIHTASLLAYSAQSCRLSVRVSLVDQKLVLEVARQHITKAERYHHFVDGAGGVVVSVSASHPSRQSGINSSRCRADFWVQ